MEEKEGFIQNSELSTKYFVINVDYTLFLFARKFKVLDSFAESISK